MWQKIVALCLVLGLLVACGVEPTAQTATIEPLTAVPPTTDPVTIEPTVVSPTQEEWFPTPEKNLIEIVIAEKKTAVFTSTPSRTTPIVTSTPTPRPMMTPLYQPKVLPPPSTITKGENVTLVAHLGGYIKDFAVWETKVFALIGPELAVLDFQLPTEPQRIGYVLLPEAGETVVTDGRFVYITHESSPHLTVADIITPTSPQIIGQITNFGAFTLQAGTNHAYVLNKQSGWLLNGVEPPQPLSLVPDDLIPTTNQTIDLAILPSHFEYGRVREGQTAVHNEKLYTITDLGELLGMALEVYDLSDSAQPRFLGSYDTILGGRFAMASDYLYVSFTGGTAGGTYIIDINDPTQPNMAGTLSTNSNGIATNHCCLYVGNRPGLIIYDIHTPLPLAISGELEIVIDNRQYQPQISTHLLLNGSYLYAVSGLHVGESDGVQFIDLADPLNPQWRGNLSTFEPLGLIQDAVIVHDMLYLAQQFGLSAIDISQPAAPVERGYYSHSEGTGNQLDAIRTPSEQTFVFLSSLTEGLRVFDVTDPTDFVETKITAVSHCLRGQDIVINGHYAYWLSGDCGLLVLNISNPAAPIIVGQHQISGWQVFVSDNNIFISQDGLFVLQQRFDK